MLTRLVVKKSNERLSLFLFLERKRSNEARQCQRLARNTCSKKWVEKRVRLICGTADRGTCGTAGTAGTCGTFIFCNKILKQLKIVIKKCLRGV